MKMFLFAKWLFRKKKKRIEFIKNWHEDRIPNPFVCTFVCIVHIFNWNSIDASSSLIRSEFVFISKQQWRHIPRIRRWEKSTATAIPTSDRNQYDDIKHSLTHTGNEHEKETNTKKKRRDDTQRYTRVCYALIASKCRKLPQKSVAVSGFFVCYLG